MASPSPALPGPHPPFWKLDMKWHLDWSGEKGEMVARWAAGKAVTKMSRAPGDRGP